MVSGSIVDSIPVDLAENKLFLSVEGQKGDCLSTLWGQKQTFPSWGSRASQPISAAPPSLLRLACLPGLSGTPKRSGWGRVLPKWSHRVFCAYSLPCLCLQTLPHWVLGEWSTSQLSPVQLSRKLAISDKCPGSGGYLRKGVEREQGSGECTQSAVCLPRSPYCLLAVPWPHESLIYPTLVSHYHQSIQSSGWWHPGTWEYFICPKFFSHTVCDI